jgi:hypothetical protein
VAATVLFIYVCYDIFAKPELTESNNPLGCAELSSKREELTINEYANSVENKELS